MGEVTAIAARDPDRVFTAIAAAFGPACIDEEARRLVRCLLRGAQAQDVPPLERRLLENGVGPATVSVLRDIRRWPGSPPRTIAVPDGHPVDLLRRAQTFIAERLEAVHRALRADRLAERPDPLREATRDLFDLCKHYARRSCCCDVLRSHGFTGIPDALLDDEPSTLGGLDQLQRLAAAPSPTAIGEARATLAHIHAMLRFEAEILLPLCCAVLTPSDWERVHWNARRFGWCPPGGDESWLPGVPCLHDGWMALPPSALIQLDGGALTASEMERVLLGLPFDIGFIDALGRVRYRNVRPAAIHDCSRAVVGRLVEHCYPAAAAATIGRIIAGFRSGAASRAGVSLELGGRMIHVQYLALRDQRGIYQGALEVITEDRAPDRIAAMARA